ncbi:MAG TPA: S1C family serine protease [Planctomycetota bacterium]|nr:S1C family serine protease [Planctomycetota bacterium]
MRAMKAPAVLAAVGAVFAACGAALAQVPDQAHAKVYEKTVDSVVAIRAMAPLGERSGSGVILSKDGLIATSYAVCPEGATKIRVWVHGPKLYEGEIVGASKTDEVVLVRIRPRGDLKPVELGTSAKVKVGDLSYSLGNAANSIILDDQPSLNVGIISGYYRLDEDRASSTYVGPVLETTAAVNVGMEGAPILDASGRMVGLVTLNYSPHRFLGNAIPIDELKPVLEKLRKKPEGPEEASGEGGEGTIGMKLKEENGKLVVAEVDPDGPAHRAGFSKGDVILEIANVKVRTAVEAAGRLKGLEAGSIIWIRVEGETTPFKLILEKKK